MTSSQAKDIIINQIKSKQSQTFLIEGSYRVGQVALSKEIIKSFTKDNSINNDVIWIKKDIDKSSIGLSEIDIIKHNINQTPLYSPYTFFVIEDADFLTKESQNALLKIIEEPSKYSIIFLLGTYHKLLPTIYSRCLTVYLDIMELTDITLGHYDLQLDMKENPDLLNTIEQIWELYLNLLKADEIEVFNYTQKLLIYPIDLLLFVLESIHFMITLAHNDKTSYTNIRLSKSLNQQLNNIVNNTNLGWNYKALDSLNNIKSTILFSNRKNILAMEEFILNNKIHI
jgi:DNA polymerase III delta prime subunit